MKTYPIFFLGLLASLVSSAWADAPQFALIQTDKASYTVGESAAVTIHVVISPENPDDELVIIPTLSGAPISITKLTDSEWALITPALNTVGAVDFQANVYLENKYASRSLYETIAFYKNEIAQDNIQLSTATDPTTISTLQNQIARDQGLVAVAETNLSNGRRLVETDDQTITVTASAPEKMSTELTDPTSVFVVDANRSDRIYTAGETASFSVTLLTGFTGSDGLQEAVVRAKLDGASVSAVPVSAQQYSFTSHVLNDYQIGKNGFVASVLTRSQARSNSLRDAIQQAQKDITHYQDDLSSTTDPDRQAYDRSQIQDLTIFIQQYDCQLEASLVLVATQVLDFTVRPARWNVSLPRTGSTQTLNLLSQLHSPSGSPLTIASVGTASRGSVSLSNGVVTYTPASDTSGSQQFRVFQADLAPGGVQPNGNISSSGAIAAKGGPYLGFSSTASNLQSLNVNGNTDGYIFDVLNDQLSWVTPTYNLQQPNNAAYLDTLSENGRFVAFDTTATNMLPPSMNTNGKTQLYVFDRLTQTLKLVTVDDTGNPGSLGGIYPPVLSADGSTVSFASLTPDLVNINTGGFQQVYVRNLITGVTQIASVTSAGFAGNGNSGTDTGPSGLTNSGGNNRNQSLDGRYVMFPSAASNLASGLIQGVKNVLVHDFQTGNNVVASVDQFGNPATVSISNPAFSDDGTQVVFYGHQANFISGATNTYQLYLRNLVTNTTSRIISGLDSSGNRDAELNDGGVYWYFQSPDFRYFGFTAKSTNVLSGFGDGSTLHCYLLDTTSNQVALLDVNANGTPMTSVSAPVGATAPGCQSVSISADGSYALISEQSANGISGNTGTNMNAFVVTRSDQFTYTATDTQGNLMTGTVTLTEPLIPGSTRKVMK